MDFKKKRNLFLARNMNVNATINVKRTTRDDEDSKLRWEIHDYIKSIKGKNKEEALQYLYEKFKDEKYKKYYKYFETWIDCEEIGKNR